VHGVVFRKLMKKCTSRFIIIYGLTAYLSPRIG
jgi:hypothetical protein